MNCENTRRQFLTQGGLSLGSIALASLLFGGASIQANELSGPTKPGNGLHF
ncbi:MAG: hypothetical protein NXI22_26160 [bacterium]|nr:hypothetical protein [bacterium]